MIEKLDLKNQENKYKKMLTIGDGLIAIILSSFVCSLVFAYEHGYCTYFGISASFIRPDATTYLAFAGVVVILSLIFFMVFDALYSFSLIIFKGKEKGPIRRFLTSHWKLTIFLFILAFFDGGSSYSFYWLIFWPLFLYFKDFSMICAMKFVKPKLSFAEIVEEYYTMVIQDRKEWDPSILDKITRKNGQIAVVIIMLFICLGVLFNAIGLYQARSQNFFYVRENPKKEIILRMYGGNAIIARYDDGLKEIYPEFRIIKLEGEKYSFKYQNLGLMKAVLPQKNHSSPFKSIQKAFNKIWGMLFQKKNKEKSDEKNG